jgi:hypothetical protein
MIIKTFDQGWGPEWNLKKYEQKIVQSLTQHFVASDKKIVVINSVWYSVEMHERVMTWLRNNDWDQIVLIAMLDAAIPYPDRYTEFGRPVTAIGHYSGAGQVDFCALFVDYFLQPPDQNLLIDASKIDTAYMCLNRKPHWHRRQLYGQLQALDLVDRGIVSMGGDGHVVKPLEQDLSDDDCHDMQNPMAPQAQSNHYGVPNDIVSLGHLGNWQRHLLNVVTETCYDINKTGFVSEKIYKPIVGCRPFLVYDPDGGTRWMRERGFEPYTQDFQDISDLDLAHPYNIPQFLVALCDQTPAYWQKKFVDLQEKILYNKAHFADYIEQQQSIVEKGIPCPI